MDWKRYLVAFFFTASAFAILYILFLSSSCPATLITNNISLDENSDNIVDISALPEDEAERIRASIEGETVEIEDVDRYNSINYVEYENRTYAVGVSVC